MVQKLAWGFGVVFIVLGILGFLPSVAPGGLLFGFFSADVMLDVIYVVSGALAVAAVWSGPKQTQLYFKVFGVIYAIFTVVGFLQGDTVFSLFTTNAADNVLHLILAAFALWAGFGSKESARMRAQAAR